VSTIDAAIHILLVGEIREVRKLRGLLDCDGSRQYHVSIASTVQSAHERLVRDDVDVLLVALRGKQPRSMDFLQIALSAAPFKPVVMLLESEDDALATELLQQGVQDFVSKTDLTHCQLSRILRYSIERHRLQKTLQRLSLIDDLTGLHNRRGFFALAEQHLRLIVRKGAAVLVCMDVDNLKRINDTFGHSEGNRALILTASTLRSCFRQSDILARVGGDEFCVLMTDAVPGTSREIRSRLLKRMNLTNGVEHWGFRLSLSVGSVDVPAVKTPPLEELLAIADELMYQHKRSNRSIAPSRIPQTSAV
jgi:two-component system, cell cycle response regulator